MNLFQPLLRGAGRKIAGERLKQSHRNVFYAIREFHHTQTTDAVDVVMEYFRLLQLKDAIVNEYNNYLGRVEDTRRLTARAVDRASPQDVAESEQDELSAKDSYLRSITNFRNALDQFKTMLGMPQTIDLRVEDSELTKLREANLNLIELDSESWFRIALQHRLPLINQIDRFEDNQRQVAISADQLKADLNIIADGTVDNDEGPTNYEDFDFNKIRANVGIQLNLPLDRLRERNQYRATLINFEESIRDLGRNFDELRNFITRDLREIDRLKQSQIIQARALELAERRVRGSELELELGTLLFRNLTESRNDLLRTQNASTNVLINLLEARLRLMGDMGVLAAQKDEFWIDPDALSVDLSEWSNRRETPSAVDDPPTPTAQDIEPQSENETVPSPEELFAD